MTLLNNVQSTLGFFLFLANPILNFFTHKENRKIFKVYIAVIWYALWKDSHHLVN